MEKKRNNYVLRCRELIPGIFSQKNCEYPFCMIKCKKKKKKIKQTAKKEKYMKKETDLEEVKNILKEFLHMPVEETELSPIIVQHPIFETGISYVNEKIVDITTPDGLEAAINKMEEKIDSIGELIKCTYIVRNSYYLTFLKFAKESLSLSDFSMLLGRF